MDSFWFDPTELKRLGIFGGTFDPPHLAHLIAGERAVQDFRLDKLLFVPANNPPHKSGQAISSAIHRLSMTQLAIHGNPKFGVSEVEIARPGPSYTIDTVRLLKKQYGPEQTYLLVGFDQLARFDSWHEFERIFEETTVIAMTRTSDEVKRINPSFLKRVKLLQMPKLDISSTDIRERICNGQSARYLITDEVRSYIDRQRLYR